MVPTRVSAARVAAAMSLRPLASDIHFLLDTRREGHAVRLQLLDGQTCRHLAQRSLERLEPDATDLLGRSP